MEETAAPSLGAIAKEVLWPSNPADRKQRKSQYKSCLLFIGVTTLLLRYGGKIADLVYNQDLLEESMRQGFN